MYVSTFKTKLCIHVLKTWFSVLDFISQVYQRGGEIIIHPNTPSLKTFIKFCDVLAGAKLSRIDTSSCCQGKLVLNIHDHDECAEPLGKESHGEACHHTLY